MADFVAFFPATERQGAPDSFAGITRDLRGPLGAEGVEEATFDDGSALLRSVDPGNASPLHVHARADGTGWIVVKGIIFDLQSHDAAGTPGRLLDQLIEDGPGDLNRYEGTFAVAAWDARNRRGWVFNDQGATMNLYFGEHGGGLYVATNAMSLARALGLALSPLSVQEFLARGSLLAPASMFRELQRISIGQHLRYTGGRLSLQRHWYAYAPETSLSRRDAAQRVADLVVDRVSRYAEPSRTVISDLTGGLDSRVVASGLERAGVRFLTTVNGPPDLEDVRVARLVARATGWPLEHFDTATFWSTPISPAMRRELTFRTSGELPFASVYHQLLSRPLLGGLGDVHMTGVGGYLRYHSWDHELYAIGRRRHANVARTVRFRFLQSPPPSELFPVDWMPAYRSRLAGQIAAVCEEFSDTRNTQQLDAVQIWQMTSHIAQYISAAYNWLPTVAPLETAGFIKAAVGVPWRYRLTSGFQRRVIEQLSPRAAAVITNYGATAEPLRLSNLHLEARQTARRAAHLATKFDKVLLKGRFSRRATSGRSSAGVIQPFLTEEFRHFLCPSQMKSGALYNPDLLERLLNGDPMTVAPLLLRIATVEQVCHELDFEPPADFLSAARP